MSTDKNRISLGVFVKLLKTKLKLKHCIDISILYSVLSWSTRWSLHLDLRMLRSSLQIFSADLLQLLQVGGNHFQIHRCLTGLKSGLGSDSPLRNSTAAAVTFDVWSFRWSSNIIEFLIVSLIKSLFSRFLRLVRCWFGFYSDRQLQDLKQTRVFTN